MEWIARQRDWRQFFRFAIRVAAVTGSAYQSALLLDPEIAQATRGAPRMKNPALFRFTNVMHLLTDIGDILYKQAAKDPATASLPRPLTATDHLKLQRRQTGMNRTIARFSPTHTDLTPRVGD